MSVEAAPKWEEDGFSIYVVLSEECEDCFEIVSKEDGWNLTLSKLKKVREEYPLHVFVMKKSHEAVATASAVPTFPEQYLIGNLVVNKAFRGQGIGKKFMNFFVEAHKDDKLTLCSVLGTHNFYRKFGFKEVGQTHHLIRIMVDRPKLDKEHSLCFVDDTAITSYTPDIREALTDYDTSARGYDASRYMSVVIETSDTLLVATSKPTGDVVGYVVGVVKPSHIVVDGLYADSDTIALMLFRKLVEAYPEHNEFKVQVIKPRDFLAQFGEATDDLCEYERMSIGETKSSSLSKLYSVSDCDYSE